MSSDTKNLSDAYFPMLVVEGDGSVDAQFQLWTQFRQLTPEKKDILVSKEIAEKILEFQERFNLQETSVAALSLVIRKMFFGEIDAAGAEAKIGSFLTTTNTGNPNQAKAIVEAIQKEVFTIHPAPELVIEEEIVLPTEPRVKTVRLPLLKAMSEYRHLSEQILTNEKIKLKSSMEPVRASLGNWLRSYREELGIGVHEPVLRGNFLFQSQNGKHLSNEERARLNLVLKSIEEGFPLEIDTEHETILFPSGDDASMELTQVKSRPMDRFIQSRSLSANRAPAVPTPDKPSAFQSLKPLFTKPAAPEKNVSGETLHFSTGHVLPAERETPTAAPDGGEALRQMQHPVQSIKREPKEPLVRSPYSIRPLRSRSGNTGAPHDTHA